MKLLIIEDMQEIRNLMCLALRNTSVDLITAENAKEGLLKAHQELPDVITLDLELPDMHGLEVCHALKDIPVIIVSSLHGPEIYADCKAARAIAYLNKPFKLSEFVWLVMNRGQQVLRQ